MPLIKLKHVVSFSSEDNAHPAENLLKPETYRKWRCASSGEKQASVILELEKATQIHSIDIGNNGSALVEALVGRSSCDPSESYKVLLVTSSFMSPSESKTFTNTSRVRMFGPDKLSKQVAEQKWDRVKFVCTQPFNKNEAYGLSFISLHSPPEPELDIKPAMSEESSVLGHGKKKLGLFTVRDEDDSLSAQRHTSFLFKKERKPSPPPMSTAAAVRLASSAATTSAATDTPSAKYRQPVATNKAGEGNNSSHSRPAATVKATAQVVKKSSEGTSKRKLENLSRSDSSGKGESSSKSTAHPGSYPPPNKRSRASAEPKDKVPVNQILNGVVFVLSGFQNPERGRVRDKALEMGAQYKPDWNRSCTHLICAFANTPKFNQVKGEGRGKIVSKKWITDCYKKEKKLPTRHYHLAGDSSSSEGDSKEEETTRKPPARKHVGSAKADFAESNESSKDKVGASTEIESKTGEKPNKTPKPRDDTTGTTSESSKSFAERKSVEKGRSGAEIGLEKEGNDTKAADWKPSTPRYSGGSSSELDTEDELRRVQENDDDIYAGSTEDEDESKENIRESPESKEEAACETDSGDLPELADFFSHKHFFLYGELDSGVRRLLMRYITAYDGVIQEYMNDEVNFVVTTEDWDNNFDDALSENASLAFVRPKWIFACHEKGSMVPFQRYLIVPPS